MSNPISAQVKPTQDIVSMTRQSLNKIRTASSELESAMCRLTGELPPYPPGTPISKTTGAETEKPPFFTEVQSMLMDMDMQLNRLVNLIEALQHAV